MSRISVRQRFHLTARRSAARSVATAVLIGAFVSVTGGDALAQWVVYDAATTARNSVTATLKEYLYQTQLQQRLKIRDMARRLSALTNLRKYATEDVPRWRTHGSDFFYAQPYNDALI